MDEYDDSFSAGGVDGGSHDVSDGSDTTDYASTGSGEDIEITNYDSGGGNYDAGEATYDFNNDGQADTAEISDGQGGELYVTDSDGDGVADTAVDIDSSGHYTVVADPAEDGNWQVEETGTVDAEGNVHPDSGSGDAGSASPAPTGSASS